MTAMLLTGHGGPDTLEPRNDVPTPEHGIGVELSARWQDRRRAVWARPASNTGSGRAGGPIA